MNIRNVWFSLLLLTTVCSTGCSGMRNFFFGRGARCGLCSRLGTAGQALNPLAPSPTTRAPCGAAPYAPAAPYAAAPAYAPAPTCGMGGGAPGPMAYGGNACGSGISGGYSVGMPADCGCGSESYPSGANYYGGSDYVTPGYETVVPNGVIEGDNFQNRAYGARRYDSQGDWIVQEEQVPPGVRVRD